MTVMNIEASGPNGRLSRASEPVAYHNNEESVVVVQKQESNSQQRLDMIPDGGYGWVCVACCFLINAHTWGINSSYGIFLSHYLTYDTFPGATPLEYAFVGGLSISMSLAVSPIATICVRKYGTRGALSLGIFFETAGLLGASWSSKIWHLFLSQGLAFGIGMGFLFVASVGIIPQWFSKKRSFANSIGSAGSGIGGLIYSLATDRMIQTVGLGWAFRILAIVACVVNIICAILVRDRNKAVGSVQLAFDVQLFRRTEFLLLLAWGFLSMLGYVVLLFSLPNYARSIGLTAQQGAGRPFIGYFSDAAGRINIAGGATFAAGFFCLVIWIFAKSYGVLIFFSLVGGVVAGTFWATIGPVGAEVVGVQILPSALSIMWVVLVIPTTFSEPIGLQLRRPSGNIYIDAQLFAGFMYVGAAICMWFLRAWKISELKRRSAERGIGADRDVVEKEENGLRSQKSRTASVKTATKGLWSWKRV